MSIQHEQQQDPEDTSASENNLDLPPFVKTWKQFYLLLVAWLIFLIAAFYLFTKYFQ